MALTKRSVKGSALTNAELDANFTHLGGDGTYPAPSTKGTAGQVLKMNAGATALEFGTDEGTDVVVDTTPQLGGNLDVNGNKIVSASGGDIDIEPDGTGDVLLGNFKFDADATVGAGQDNMVMTYDHSAGKIALEASAGGDLVVDTTPQLGGNLDVQTHSVVSVSNQSISVTPHGSGRVVLDGLNYPSADGSAGEVLKTDGSGNLSFGSAGGGSATAVVANNAGLQALSGNSVGDFAFVTGTNKLYIRNSNGWYLIATVTNATPTISSAGSPNYTFATDGTPVVVTIVATEPEGETITYAYTVSSGSLTNGGGATATVVQGTGGDVNKFTITPTTNSSYAGAFSLTFTAQDPNGNTANSNVSTFTLGFDTAGSLYFDGTGDAIIHASNSNFSMGTGDYTIEMWINWTNDSDQSTALAGNEYILDLGGNKSFFKHISGKIRAAFGTHSDYVEFTPSASEFKGWHHMAMTRQGNVHTFWYDGSNKGQQTVSYTHSTTTLTVGGYDNGVSGGGGYNWGPGYLSNIRIVKGTAVYTSGFTPSTAPLEAISGTVYLIANNTIPTNVSNGSYYFPATDRKLTSSTSSDFTMGTSTDFTVEFWYKIEGNNINSSGYWFDMGSNTFVIQYFSSNTKVGIWNGSFSIQGNTGVGTATNKWFHAVAQRSGSTFQLFIDGVSQGTSSTSHNLNGTSITLNNYGGGGSYGQVGYLSDFRVVKGTAVYSGNFTPPNGPLTKTGGSYPSNTNVNTSIPSGNTKLLTGQNSSGGFIDNSDSAHTLTPGGTVTQANGVVIETTDVSSVGHDLTFEGNVAFSYATPFLSGGGGSIYFDGGYSGTADWISGTVVGPGASDNFTLEMWIKPTSINPAPYAQNGMVQIRSTAMSATGSYNGLGFAYRGGGTGMGNHNEWKMIAGTTFYATYDGIQNDALAPPTDSWTHVAQIRTGTVTSLFVNGKGVIKAEGDNNSYSTSTHLGLGAYYSTAEAIMNGYISNFRYIVGSGPYTVSNGTGGSSNFPNGASDALLAASMPALGADDWTVEFYLKLSHTFEMGLIQVGKDNGSLSIYMNGSNKIVVEGNQTGGGYTSATSITTNGWHHIAVVNDGTANTQTTYINGAADANTGSRGTAYTYTEDTVIIGARWYASAIKNTAYRYISNVRITKAKVYTGNFIVPWSELTAITNCQLLTCQNTAGAIADASTNNLTITSPGNVVPVTGTPYHPATGAHPFIGQITPPTTALSAITNTKLLTANQSNAINDDSTSNVSLTINGTGAIATKQTPF